MVAVDTAKNPPLINDPNGDTFTARTWLDTVTILSDSKNVGLSTSELISRLNLVVIQQEQRKLLGKKLIQDENSTL